MVKESVGNTAYCFSTPIYNIKTKTLVQTNFITTKTGASFKGTNGLISVNQNHCIFENNEKADTNVDLEYDVSDDGVKESIVLTKNPDCKTFTFQLKFKGLLPVLSEDKKVVSLVRDDDDLDSEMPEMKIPPAYMEDANDAFCDDIHYEIRKTDER